MNALPVQPQAVHAGEGTQATCVAQAAFLWLLARLVPQVELPEGTGALAGQARAEGGELPPAPAQDPPPDRADSRTDQEPGEVSAAAVGLPVPYSQATGEVVSGGSPRGAGPEAKPRTAGPGWDEPEGRPGVLDVGLWPSGTSAAGSASVLEDSTSAPGGTSAPRGFLEERGPRTARTATAPPAPTRATSAQEAGLPTSVHAPTRPDPDSPWAWSQEPHVLPAMEELPHQSRGDPVREDLRAQAQNGAHPPAPQADSPAPAPRVAEPLSRPAPAHTEGLAAFAGPEPRPRGPELAAAGRPDLATGSTVPVVSAVPAETPGSPRPAGPSVREDSGLPRPERGVPEIEGRKLDGSHGAADLVQPSEVVVTTADRHAVTPGSAGATRQVAGGDGQPVERRRAREEPTEDPRTEEVGASKPAGPGGSHGPRAEADPGRVEETPARPAFADRWEGAPPQRLRVELVDAHGEPVRVEVRARSEQVWARVEGAPEVARVVRTEAPALQRALAGHGLSLSGLEVDASSGGQHGAYGEPPPPPPPPARAVARHVRPHRPAGAVDYVV